MSIRNLDAVFRPKRIAVFGANDEPGSLGGTVFRNLVGAGFKGAAYPINPHVEAVHGVEAFASVADIPHDIDLAIFSTTCAHIVPQLDACGEKHVKGVILLCPDFHYRTKNPKQFEQYVHERSLKYGFRVLGPNSLGFIRPSIGLNASLFPHMPMKGNIAFVSESSTFSVALLERAVHKQVGISFFGAIGSRFDICFSDMIDYLGMDTETRAIVLYIESIESGRRFMTAVRSFACSKPIVVVKSGKYPVSAQLAQIAQTHAGMLAGEDRIYDAAFKRAGAVRVDDVLDLFYLAETLEKQKRPRGNKLAIVSNSGGLALMAVDVLVRQGGELAVLSDESVKSIREKVALAGLNNPIDLLSDASPQMFDAAVRACLKDKGVDGVLVIQTPTPGSNLEETAEAVAAAARDYAHKPVLTSWMGAGSVEAARDILATRGIPTFVTSEQAVRAFVYMYRYDDNLRLLLETPEAILRDFKPDKKHVETMIRSASEGKRLLLTFFEVKEILSAYGIPVIETQVAQSEEDAVRIAAAIGYPVVLKVDTPTIFHKLQKGGVILNVRDKGAVVEAYRSLRAIADLSGDADAKVILQPMIVRHGYELVIGAKKDRTFGSALIFGTGGELVEALQDYAVGLPPMNQALARRMMSDTRIYRYLLNQQSFAHTLKHLEEILVRFSQLIVDFPQIREIDINPFFVSDTDREGFAFDAGILLEENVLDADLSFECEFCPPHLAITPYPARYMKEVILSDGTAAVFRPIKPEDEPLIAELFKTFSEKTISLRFFQRIVDLRHEQLVRICQLDYERELAFVCVVKDGDREQIIGDARVIKLPDMENAEMAVMVGDPWQGKGVGKKLCDYCIEVAREVGIKHIWMEILRMNTYMIHLSERLFFRKVDGDEDSIRVVLDLEEKEKGKA
ncbi:MAG TPA: GNAT family N-acetyltransferase [Dissulfurispiraceae bacterium]|nr:GNAT family N-acetyltransferase [Dissulfurispiraceae bacterium]